MWVLAAGGAVMAPALAHGAYLGPFDWVARFGVSADPSVTVHNRQTFDQITEFIPWTNLAWTQVHNGHLPLWNPYSLLGTPLAFNWQSATFSVPALLGYLFPVSLAFTVQVMTTLFLAGTGAYVLGRVMGLGPLGAAAGGVVFELSGPFFGWLGWPISGVMAWTGWLFAAALLVARPGRRHGWAIALLAVVVACAVYAGQPDMLVLLGVTFLVFVVALLGVRVTRAADAGPIRRPAVDLVLGVVAGGALGAPLLLPGGQLILGSVRTAKRLSPALPLKDVSRLLIQGFDGLPVAGSRWFGDNYYTKTVAYVGGIAVALALVALVTAVRTGRLRAPVIGLSAVCLVSAAIVYLPFVESTLDGLPFIGVVLWRRATVPMAFALAILAGVGADTVVRASRERMVRTTLATGFGIVGAGLALLWLVGRDTLPHAEASLRSRSFIWPAACTAVGLIVVGALAIHGRWSTAQDSDRSWRRAGLASALGLVAAETAFLVAAGAPLWSSSATYLPTTPSERQLARVVGDQTVGLGDNGCFGHQLGIVPNLNVALGVRELADYEPLVPKTFTQAWRNATGYDTAPAVFPGVPFSVVCPAVTNVAVARQFGVAFVLEPGRHAGPSGTQFVAHIDGESLYRVPGAGPATLVAPGSGGTPPGTDAPGSVVPVTYPGPASWRMVTNAPAARLLRLRLTAVPGWHATIDGRPVAITRWSTVMLEVRVPPGHHVVEVHYWPVAFTAGIGLAAASATAIAALLLAGRMRRRRAPASPLEQPSRLGRRPSLARDARTGSSPLRT